MNTRHSDGFLVRRDISFASKASATNLVIAGTIVSKSVALANQYLFSLQGQSREMGFDIYRILGQRNLSGFVGEVFSRILARYMNDLEVNPHADGRPDLIDLSKENSRKHYLNDCFQESASGVRLPLRPKFAPYQFGGIEVKCSIGTPVSNYKNELLLKHGSTEFDIGMERLEYLRSITYWGHHTGCENLLGLYYDYPPGCEGSPQILAAFHSELKPDEDWSAVSVGKAGSKKTSNTSLTKCGRKKVLGGTVVVIDDKRYLARLRKIPIATT